MINLTNKEVTSFLGLVLERNPITNISFTQDTIEVIRFDGSIAYIPTDFSTASHEFTIPYDQIADYQQTSCSHPEFEPTESEYTDQSFVSYILDYEEEVTPDDEGLTANYDEPIDMPSYELDISQQQDLINRIDDRLSAFIDAQNSLSYPSFEYVSEELEQAKTALLEIFNSKLENERPVQNVYIEKDNTTEIEQLKRVCEMQIQSIRDDLDHGISVLKQRNEEIALTIPESISEQSIAKYVYEEISKDLITLIRENVPEIPPAIHTTVDVSDSKISPIVERLTQLEQTPKLTDTPPQQVVIQENIVNYEYIENLIQAKIDNLQSAIALPGKLVTSIENRHNRLVISFLDNTIADVTDVIVPLISSHIERNLPRRSSPGGFGGGVGGSVKGEPGYSAYEIAKQHGFVGSEEAWLASLGGGGSPVAQPGSIYRDESGMIASIVVGSVETTFNRDVSGNIVSISKPTYTKTFIRDVNGMITGWSIT